MCKTLCDAFFIWKVRYKVWFAIHLSVYLSVCLFVCLTAYLSTYLSIMLTLLLPPVCVCSPSSAVSVPAILQRHSRLPGVRHLHMHHLWITWPRGHMAQVLYSLICSTALWPMAQTGKHWVLNSAGPSEMKDVCEHKLRANIYVKFTSISRQLEPPCCRILDSGWGNMFQMCSQTCITLGTDEGQVSKTWRWVPNYPDVMSRERSFHSWRDARFKPPSSRSQICVGGVQMLHIHFADSWKSSLDSYWPDSSDSELMFCWQASKSVDLSLKVTLTQPNSVL